MGTTGTEVEQGGVGLDPAAKKTVLRHFSYGLYAVTAAHGEERGVFTANWVAQVSFDPPLVVVSVEHDSSTLGLIRASGRFAVCPLREGQKDLAGKLGRPRQRTGDKFDAFELATVPTLTGPPALADTLGFVACTVVSETPAGDSVVLLGEVVEALELGEGEPLTMRAAGFRHAG